MLHGKIDSVWQEFGLQSENQTVDIYKAGETPGIVPVYAWKSYRSNDFENFAIIFLRKFSW